MHNWLQFLQQQGAYVIDAATGSVSTNDDVLTTNFIVPLYDAGLICVAGNDAVTFLHNQLTNDVEHLAHGQARLAGYCTPKGRLLATMLIWKTDDCVLLHLPKALQATINKRLQMFVMRAKAVLSVVGEETVQLGLAGPAAALALKNWFSAVPAAPYTTVHGDAGTLIRLADTAAGIPRYLWVSDVAIAIAAWPQLTQTLQPAGSNAWRLARINAGIALITLPTQEQFVPQMINFELIGGVSFKKGCYPGQEIVARSQYLGKLKRRMLPATVNTLDIAAGDEVFSSADPDQACGMIVEAAQTNSQSSACLVEIKLVALEATVHLGSAAGPRLCFGTLPYKLSDESRPAS